jgi:hypothetical protein
MGCESGLLRNPKGCYGECYAASYAKRYGYDFGKNVRRYFDSDSHAATIRRKINRIDMPFVRMGTSGDPSEDWAHTLYVLSKLYGIAKEIVIITKHWHNLTDTQLKTLSAYNVCINTSVSALDYQDTLDNALEQYERLKPYCKSVLRVVSCEFNLENDKAKKLNNIQEKLISFDGYIDTVLRISKSNSLVSSGVVKINDLKFLGKKITASKRNKATYFGKCSSCKEMCGLNTGDDIKHYFKPMPKQYELIRAATM